MFSRFYLLTLIAVCLVGCVQNAKKKLGPFCSWPETPSDSTHDGDGENIIKFRTLLCKTKVMGENVIYAVNVLHFKELNENQPKEVIDSYIGSKRKECTRYKDITISENNYSGVELYFERNKKFSRQIVFIVGSKLFDINVATGNAEILDAIEVSSFIHSFRSE